MRILGLDPGIAIVGFGIIDVKGHKMNPVSYGAVTTPAEDSIGQRLLTIESNITTILETYQPDVCGVEEIFFSKNVKTAITVSHARGILLYCLEKMGIPTFHYSPTAIKSAIIGYGNAEKKQVQYMTKELLNLEKSPKPDDVADALAVAICHHHSHPIQSRL